MAKRFAFGLALCLAVQPLSGAGEPASQQLLKNFSWRSVGPAGAGGRVVAVAVAGDRPQTIYVGVATGGVWKSTNQGTSWQPIFDHESVSSIGDLTVDPTNADTVWVGTGEANPRNSVSWGNGVYKSINGGKTWTNVGLRDTQHIGRVVVDPRNPNTVYVAALGHIWGPNKERGVFKTTDGGTSWTTSLFVDENTGIVDLIVDPHDSNSLLAAAYEVRRDGFAGGDPAKGWGPGSGIYKTSDAGKTWRRLSDGLPPGPLGRIGLAVADSNPSVIYAIVQTPTTVPRERDEETPSPLPSAPKTMKDGGLFRSDDRGETWKWVNAIDPRPFYHSQVRVDPTDENHLYVLGSPIAESHDGGRTFQNQPWNIHVDHHALWIDPRNPQHMINGNDGGIYVTWDAGTSWDFQNQVAISQFYSVDVDMRKPYYIYGGVQDYCSWGGPSRTRKAVGIQVSDWFKVQTGDGFQVRVDPTDYTIVYAESQNGGLVRHDLKSGRNTAIKPRARRGSPAYRFNWETPIVISAHDPKTLYVGANVLFRSINRGDAWTVISPELTTDKAGTITTIAESPLDAATIYAGTDDGNVWATRDAGKNWTNITSGVTGVAGKRWVSRLVASRYEPGTVYLAFDGHRSDDLATYLFRSADYGQTWTSIKGDLPPMTPVRVVREDVRNRHLLFAGTESAAYASIDDGQHWLRLMNNMPTVPVADLIVHPRDAELVAGTHGRSFYVMDIAPLEELTPEILASDAHLFTVRPEIAYDDRVFTNDEFLAQKRFIANNPPAGTTISYYVKAEPRDVKLAILDKAGTIVRELAPTKQAGINRVQWDLRGVAPVRTQRARATGSAGASGATSAAGATGATSAAGAPPAGGPFGAPPQGALVDPGEYVARLTIDGRELTTPVTVLADPEVTISDADRESRRTFVSSVLALQARAEPAGARIDSASEQLDALVKTVNGIASAPESAKNAVAAAAKDAAALKLLLGTLNRSVMQLFFQTSGSPFVPTETQRAELEDLRTQFDENAAWLEKIVKTDLPALEKTLDAAGIPRIVVGP